jgi:two-component system, cell cycle response regulator DivK
MLPERKSEVMAAPLVLVVEDYPDAREMYSEYLRFSGFRVAEARNGEEALEKAFTLLPDVVLMDLALPLMDGWEATRRLKGDPRTAQILVVALTGHALAGHAEGARRAGCDAFVTKPCLPDELVDEIRRLLAVRQTAPTVPRQVPSPASLTADAVPIVVRKPILNVS